MMIKIVDLPIVSHAYHEISCDLLTFPKSELHVIINNRK